MSALPATASSTGPITAAAGLAVPAGFPRLAGPPGPNVELPAPAPGGPREPTTEGRAGWFVDLFGRW